MSKLVLIVALITIGQCFAVDQVSPNDLIDKTLTEIKDKYAAQLSPISVPDLVIEFKTTSLFPVKGSGQLTDGTITGLDQIARAGEATPIGDQGDFSVKIQFGSPDGITAHYAGKVSIPLVSADVEVNAAITNIEATLEVGVNADGVYVIKSVTVSDKYEITVHVHEPTGALDKVLDVFAQAFATSFKPIVDQAVKQLIETVVQQGLTDVAPPKSA